MEKYTLTSKCLTIGVILFFIVTGIFPSTKSELTHDKNIITVDDEPGDADFTSIKEAVNYSSPGNIIEVYSGTYLEEEICIGKENISLLGISHELGEGNDIGKPFIRGNESASVIQIEASNVIVSNFVVENPSDNPSFYNCCIFVGTEMTTAYQNNTISECIIRNSTDVGIRVGRTGWNLCIINNEISHCGSYGINAPFTVRLNISGNVIADCYGIYFGGSKGNVSRNWISNCKYGILIHEGNNIIYGNDIENCSISVKSIGLRTGNKITKNNFKNYSLMEVWWERSIGIYFFGSMVEKKNRWIENYWDTWSGVGPKKIFGNLILWRDILEEFLITIPIL